MSQESFTPTPDKNTGKRSWSLTLRTVLMKSQLSFNPDFKFGVNFMLTQIVDFLKK